MSSDKITELALTLYNRRYREQKDAHTKQCARYETFKQFVDEKCGGDFSSVTTSNYATMFEDKQTRNIAKKYLKSPPTHPGEFDFDNSSLTLEFFTEMIIDVDDIGRLQEILGRKYEHKWVVKSSPGIEMRSSLDEIERDIGVTVTRSLRVFNDVNSSDPDELCLTMSFTCK